MNELKIKRIAKRISKTRLKIDNLKEKIVDLQVKKYRLQAEKDICDICTRKKQNEN